MPRSQLSAAGLASAATLIWATPPVIARAVSGGVPPIALSYSRWVLGLLLLLPFVWGRLPDEWPKLRPHIVSLSLLSLFMIAGSTLATLAVYFTTATNAVLVNASQPAITACVAYFVTRERLSRLQALGVACAFSGIVIMISRADPAVLTSLDIAVGDLIMLCAVIGWSLYAVFVHRREYSPAPDILLFFIAVVGAIVMLPFYALEAFLAGGFEPRLVYGLAMVYLAVFPTLLATHCWNNAIHTLGANRAAIFVNLIPVFGACLAMLFLGERLFAYHFAGAVLVFTGIALAARHR
ncbi:MAG: DMT family transporter [Gammaproteobacteria bacterium]|jgi:drug/metabolite transporter (DMT)-like permease